MKLLRLLPVLLAAVLAATAEPALEPIAPIVAPFPMPQLQRPDFPARVVDIRDHGAVPGGEVKNTASLARAIAACAEAGGGRVLVPAGRWLTGAVHLRSHIELHLAEGAELVFSDDPADYLPPVLVRNGGVELYNYSPFIYARDCTDVGVTGPGRLNGNAKAWYAWAARENKAFFQAQPRGIPVGQRVYATPADAIRPNFLVLFNCRKVLLEGFTIGGGANWTIHPVYSENVIIRRVHVLTEGPNNDGIDPDSCRNVLIEHCVFDTGDDCVVLKSGYNEDGWRVARPMENLVMRWCRSRRGHGGLVIGSEMSGDVRNVYVHDCEFEGTDRIVRIKSRRGRGGVVENVWAENLRGTNLKYEGVILNMDYSADRNRAANERAPLFRHIHVRNLTVDGAPAAIRMVGLEDSLIADVTFRDVAIRSTEGVFATHVSGLSFENVAITPAQGPAFVLTNARGVEFRSCPVPAGPFVAVADPASTGIVIHAPTGPAPQVVRAPDTAPDAVTVH